MSPALVLLLTSALAATPDPPDPPPLEEALLGTPVLEWRESWDATWEANAAALKQEERSQDASRRHEVVLLLAMLERFSPEPAQRLFAYRRLAESLERLGYRFQSLAYRRRIVEEFPRETQAVVDALSAILWQAPRAAHVLDRCDDPAGWIEWAAARCTQAGASNVMSPDCVELAWRALFDLRLNQGRYLEAEEALEELESLSGPSRCRFERSILLEKTGAIDEARALLESVVAEAGEEEDEKARDLLRELEERLLMPPLLPSAVGIETRWRGFLAQEVRNANEVLWLLRESSRGEGLVRAGPRRYLSVWTTIDRSLAGLAPEVLEQLNEATTASSSEVADDPHGRTLMREYRRNPWARDVGERLFHFAVQALRRGRVHTAWRCFEDAAAHAPTGELARHARSGADLALQSLAPGPERPEGVRLPAPVPLDHCRVLQLPAPLPGAAGFLRLREDALVLAGAGGVALYDKGESNPRWLRSTLPGPPIPDEDAGPFPMAAPVVPAVDGDCLMIRATATFQRPLGDLLALEKRTGTPRWSTADCPDWQALTAASDAVPAEGCVYVLAAPRNQEAFSSLLLVGLDATEGSFLWQTQLGAGTAVHQPDRGSESGPALGGCALTVQQGAVYCATNIGLVARCDARDGLIEWLVTYPRQTGGPAGPADSRGDAPLVIGDTVIFAPPDLHGLLALDPSTGAVRWRTSLVGVSELLGAAGQTVVVREGRRLVGVDAGSGRVDWTWEPEKPLDAAVLGSGAIYVRVAEQLYRLQPTSGRLEEEAVWKGASELQGLAVTGDGLAALSPEIPVARSVQPADRGSGRLSLPLCAAGFVSRRRVSVAVARAHQKMPDWVVLAGDGTVECRQATGLAARWRRMVPRQTRRMFRLSDTVVLYGGRQLQALDISDGSVRWEADLPFARPRLLRAGRDLCAWTGDWSGEQVAMLDPADGSLRWQRSFVELRPRLSDLEAVFHAQGHLHLFYEHSRLPGKVPAVVKVSPRDGRVLEVLPFRLEGAPRHWIYTDDALACITRDGRCVEYLPADGTHVVHAGTADLELSELRRTEVDGSWIVLTEFHHGRTPDWRTIALRRGDPEYLLVRGGEWRYRDGLLYRLAERGHSVEVMDLEKQEQGVYDLLIRPHWGPSAEPRNLRIDGTRLWVFSLQRGNPWAPWHTGSLRVDIFDRESCRLEHCQLLPRATGERMEPFLTEHALLITGANGLFSFVPADNGRRSVAEPPQVVHLAGAPVTVNGILDEWSGADCLVAESSTDPPGKVLAQHDGRWLYLAITHPERNPVVALGSGGASGGSRLEIGWTLRDRSHRWEVRAGRSEAVAARLRGVARMDLLSGHRVYEVAIPLPEREWQDPSLLRAGLSLEAWTESPEGPRCVLRCGRALDGLALLERAHAQLSLVSRPSSADKTLRAEALQDPGRPGSREYLLEYVRRYAADPEALRLRVGELVARRPVAVTADLLLSLDRELYVARWEDMGPWLLRHAREAGVSEIALDRYQALREACLLQEVFVPEPLPHYLALDARADGDGRRAAFWLSPQRHWSYGRGALRLGGGISSGRWQTLRIPLYLWDLHDRPIAYLGFGQSTEGDAVLWGRTALLAYGREHVLIDGALPPGKPDGAWEWRTAPGRDVPKAHSEGTADSENPVFHGIEPTPPFADHLAAPGRDTGR